MNLSNGTVTTSYDPAGRLRQIGASSTTQFLYDGPHLIAEYDAASGAMLNRYVPGVASYDGAGTKSWYHTDAQGSVIATSDASGNAVTIDQYGPFGEPGLLYQGRNQGRMRYTGQAMLTEVGEGTSIGQILYDYKARIYAPKLGRFLQTDPIGAQDDRNLYAYVGNDPINRIDPRGLAAEYITSPSSSFNKVTAHDISATSVCWKACGPGLSATQYYSPAQQAGALAAYAGVFVGAGAAAEFTLGRMAASGFGDLTVGEVGQIRDVVNQAGRPLDVIGSAARGARQAGSDIDYVTHPSNLPYYNSLESNLPGIDSHGIIPGNGNPFQGPVFRFEPGLNPTRVIPPGGG